MEPWALESLRKLDELERREDAERRALLSYECPHCGAKSFSVHDIKQRYCGRCHRFADDPVYNSEPEP